jgi:hypothetical protein
MGYNSKLFYTWICKDWAYSTMTRTFSIHFADKMEAIKWETLVELSKANNCRIRQGLDVPDDPTDELSDIVKKMCA